MPTLEYILVISSSLTTKETLDKLTEETDENAPPPQPEEQDPDFGGADDDFGLGSLRQDRDKEMEEEPAPQRVVREPVSVYWIST